MVYGNPPKHSPKIKLSSSYCSTRGGVHGWSFQDVIFSGYAPDGGMFMPECLPKLSPDTLRSWSKMTYPEVVMEVTSLFIPTQVIPREDLQGLVYAALSGFSVPEVVRLVRLKDGLSVLELFHGETLAFKDLAMTCSVRFLDYLLQKERRRATIIICTSGDTGGSAVQSAKGLSAMDVVVLYPAGRVTPVQEKHMITCLEDNVHVFSAGGTSDDLDVLACRLFADQELVKRHGLMSLNSVNWSRVMLQLAHFIYAYLQMSGVEGSERDTPLPLLEVVVPTGGAGNIAAGCIVKHMGVPLQMVAMVNANDTLHRTVRSGDFSKAASVTQTLASAIDIQFPYNMERVFWLLSGRDGALVTKIMEEFHSDKHTLSDNLHKALSQVLSTETVSDEGIVETMKKCWEENQYLLCPHTAVGVWHHYHCNPDPAIYRCYIATASPAKFEGAVHRAGLTVDLPEAVRALDKMPTRSQHLERSLHWLTDWEDRMRERLQAITSARDQSVTYYN